MGRSVGETAAVVGTSPRGSVHTHSIAAETGRCLLTDTPGLCTARLGRRSRGRSESNWLPKPILCCSLSITTWARTDRQTLLELASLGERLIVVLNKRWIRRAPRVQALTKLRERLEGVSCPVRSWPWRPAYTGPGESWKSPDGTTEAVLEAEAPALEALEDALTAVLESEGNELRAGNVLLRARRPHEPAKNSVCVLTASFRAQHWRSSNRSQWIAAVTAFADPVLALGPMAIRTVRERMLSEMAAAYNVTLSAAPEKSSAGKWPRRSSS